VPNPARYRRHRHSRCSRRLRGAHARDGADPGRHREYVPTNNIADFVNQLPSLAASIRPSNSRLELSNGQAGINALNLRSLGTVRTLVLLDGRRSVGSTANGSSTSTPYRNPWSSASK
jgi:hypothetical protein